MWAGGSFTFSTDPKTELRIGEQVAQKNSVRSAEFKSGMIFVQQQRDLYRMPAGESIEAATQNENGWAVREIRTHVFRQEVGANDQIKAKAKAGESEGHTP